MLKLQTHRLQARKGIKALNSQEEAESKARGRRVGIGRKSQRTEEQKRAVP